MIDLKRISPIFYAKFGVVVTIMVMTSACAHELFIAPSNNDSVGSEISQMTPEPSGPAKASAISDSKASKGKYGKRVAKHSARKAHKHTTVARNTHKIKTVHAAATVASAKVQPKAPAAPAPQIAPPPVPAPLASAGVQTEIDGDSGSPIGTYLIYGLVALAIGGLIFVAPRARRGKPRRKLVYNG